MRPTADGVVLICENCGHENALAVSRSNDDGPATEVAEVTGERSDDSRPLVTSTARGEQDEESVWLEKGALERLVPEPGDGPRCRKCALLLTPGQEYCARCGLSVAEGERYPEGEAPWERPTTGREAEHEQATLLWKSVQEDPTDENLTKFADFARDEELLEYGVRQLRQFLIQHPDHDLALGFLRELAASFQARVIVAQAQAQVRADDFVQKTDRFKQALLWVVFIVWGGIFIAFLVNIADGCG